MTEEVKPTCATCPYYGAERETMDRDYQRDAYESKAVGVCRRRAPTWMYSMIGAFGPQSGFPHVEPDDWCGEHPIIQTQASVYNYKSNVGPAMEDLERLIDKVGPLR
jgi:hypothetical protein